MCPREREDWDEEEQKQNFSSISVCLGLAWKRLSSCPLAC